MNETIENILAGIDKGTYFDSHFVIDTVIRNHSDAYLTFAASHKAKGKVTEYVHSEIAKVISLFEDEDKGLVKRVERAESLSFNIRGNASKCALWVKV